MRAQASLEQILLILVSIILVAAVYVIYTGFIKSESSGLNETVDNSINTIKNWANA